MEVNELQIGDWVLDGNVYAQVTSITCDGNIETTHNEHSNIELIEPIRLTPEILEKIGFKKSDFFHVENKHQWSWWENAQTSIMLWCCSLDDDPKDGWMVRIEGESITLCMRVLFLHDLQQAMRIMGCDKEIEL